MYIILSNSSIAFWLKGQSLLWLLGRGLFLNFLGETYECRIPITVPINGIPTLRELDISFFPNLKEYDCIDNFLLIMS